MMHKFSSIPEKTYTFNVIVSEIENGEIKQKINNVKIIADSRENANDLLFDFMVEIEEIDLDFFDFCQELISVN